MAWRFVKQPNGLLARFSDVMDDFTDYDLTVSEALALCDSSMSRDEAWQKVQRGVNDEPIPDFIEASGRNDGLDRWRNSIDTIRMIHGQAEADERAKELSVTHPEAKP